jgi:hypothetical protein
LETSHSKLPFLPTGRIDWNRNRDRQKEEEDVNIPNPSRPLIYSFKHPHSPNHGFANAKFTLPGIALATGSPFPSLRTGVMQTNARVSASLAPVSCP